LATLDTQITEARVLWLPACTKEEALGQLVDAVCRSTAVRDKVALQQAILSREVMMSTGLGYGVALPHARIAAVERFVVAMGVVPEGIAWGGGMDDDPVRLVAMIAGPDHEQAGYLRLLSTLMKFIKSEKGRILAASTAEEVLRRAARYEVGDNAPAA
jgi:mannitol/fructose-specific phosphotransferase system IIA component (Ntr-type)